MGVLTTASAVVALLALVRAAPVCEELVKPLHLKDLTPITGKWWFLSGFSDNQLYTDILQVVNSSWITLTPSGQEDTLIVSQANKINGKCEFHSTNLTHKNGLLHMAEMFDGNPVTTEIAILPSGTGYGYLTMKMNHKMANNTIRSLYVFGRSAQLSEAELEALQRQAECLGYSTPAPYIYDGITELCNETQHKEMCEPLLKHQEITDLTQLMGKWVFLEGFVSHKMFIDFLKTVSSAWMDWTPTPDTDNILMTQGNKLNGNCVFSRSNGSMVNSVFHATEIYEGQALTTKGWVLPSGKDTLIMRLDSIMGGQKIYALYMFGRSSQASATDKGNFQKQAECLGWIRQAHYTYDGVTELCEESRISP